MDGLDEKQIAEVFDYLDDLRSSGQTNMYGAGVYLERDFDFTQAQNRKLLLGWMRTFDPNKTPAERAAQALDPKPKER